MASSGPCGRVARRVLVASGIVLALVLGAPGSPVPAAPAGADKSALDDLLFDLQLVPLGGAAPRPFDLVGLDGRRMRLADLRGRPALIYFWASW